MAATTRSAARVVKIRYGQAHTVTLPSPLPPRTAYTFRLQIVKQTVQNFHLASQKMGGTMSSASKAFRTVGAAAAFMAMAHPGSASVVYWTDWTADTVGKTTGSAAGTIATLTGNIAVSYSGEVTGQTHVNGTGATGYPSWQPASSYADGTIVADAPTFRDLIAQNGGAGTGVNTITFATPVDNPVMAIWSLGSPGINANYTFSGSEPFTIVAGGPSAEYGGGGLVPNGGSDSVTGSEGNGTLQFIGTYSQLTFTNTVFENYYGFTLGVDGVASSGGPTPMPEPAGIALLSVGLAGLGLARRPKP